MPDAVHVFSDERIVVELGFALDFLSHLAAERNLFFERIEVDALADIAVADLVGVFLLVLGPHPTCDHQQHQQTGEQPHIVILDHY